MQKLAVAMFLILTAVSGSAAQLYEAKLKVPNAEALSSARKMVNQLFANLVAGKSEDIAAWIIEQMGQSYSEADKITKRVEFKSKLDLVLAGPPTSPYGKLDGYDLLDEAYLRGSNRYFRFVYISYHEGAPLLWEFRFYVQPGGAVTLHHISWDESNPFEYMSTSAIRLPKWDAD